MRFELGKHLYPIGKALAPEFNDRRIAYQLFI